MYMIYKFSVVLLAIAPLGWWLTDLLGGEWGMLALYILVPVIALGVVLGALKISAGKGTRQVARIRKWRVSKGLDP